MEYSPTVRGRRLMRELTRLYGVCSPEREALLQLCRDARKRGWWTAYADVFTGSYIGMEAEAASIRVNAHIVPGPFQTPDYARQVIARTGLKLTPEKAERRVAARIVRQEALFAQLHRPRLQERRPGPPGLQRRCVENIH